MRKQVQIDIGKLVKNLRSSIDGYMNNTAANAIEQLQAELDRAKYVVSKFENWYSDTGCPMTETKESFCPCLKELKEEYDEEMNGVDEQDRIPFSPEDDCELQTSEGWCYARYYEKKFDLKENEK